LIDLEKTTLYSLQEIKKKIKEAEQFLHKSLERDGKKRSGSYYTPIFIVEYMVKNTISKAIVDRINNLQRKIVFKDIEALTKCQDLEIINLLFHQILPTFVVCDLAMGWGIFLLYAFDFFLSFYLSFHSYIIDNMNYSFRKGSTAQEWIINNIISNNIWGFDLSSESVKLGKLKLIERALISLNQETAYLSEFKLFVANSLLNLPHLSKNRKESNKAYFDVILGNPPYVNVKKLDIKERKLYSQIYKTYNPNGDISNVFWEKSLELCKDGGRISLITPRYWLEGNDSDKLREYILANSSISEIIDFRSNRTLFLSTENRLGVDTAIITIQKHTPSEKNISVLISLKDTIVDSINKSSFKEIKFNQNLLSKKRWTFEKNSTLAMLEDNVDYYLGDDKKYKEFNGICHIGKGCSTGNNKIFRLKKLSNQLFEGHNKLKVPLEKYELKVLRVLIKNSDISRFIWKPGSDYWIFLKDEDIEKYPNIKNYLLNFMPQLERTQIKYGLKNYYDYAAYRSLNLINSSSKFICPYQAIENRFALIFPENPTTINETDIITLTIKEKMSGKIEPLYLLSVLNSELIQYFTIINNKKIYNLYDFRSNQIAHYPIKKCNKQTSFTYLTSFLIQILQDCQSENSRNLLLDLLNTLVYELYFEQLLSTEFNDKIEQYLIQIPLQEVESVDSSAVNRILNKLLNDDSVKKDIKKIRNLKQVQEIQKFIKLH